MERKRANKLPWAIVLLIIALSCVLAWLGARLFVRVQDRNSFGHAVTVTVDGLKDVQAVSDGFVYYDDSVISKVGSDGQTRWRYTVGAGATMEATDQGVAVWVGKKLTLLNGKTGMADFSGNMDADVITARLGQQYAAVFTGESHNGTMVIMEHGGRRIDSIALTDLTVVDYGFFYKGTLFWVMTLDTNGTTPSCTVNTYRPGRRQVGAISDGEQVIYHVAFQSSQICVVGDNFVKVFDYSGTEQKEKRVLVYGWTLVDADDESDNPLMAFTMNGENDNDSLIRNVRLVRGMTSQIMRMPYGCSKLVAAGDRVYGFSGEGYVMIARLGRQKADAYALPVAFDRVLGITDDNVAMLGYGNSISLVSLE